MHDVHTHFIPQEVMDWLHENEQAAHVTWEKTGRQHPFLTINGKWGFELKPSFIDSQLYLQEQARHGVKHSLVSPIPQLFLYDLPSEMTCELASVYNHALARWVQQHPEQLSALATLPMNVPEKAAEELSWAMDAGLKGAIIGPGWKNHLLSDDMFTPFWEVAERRRAIVFIHPLLNEDPRLKRHRMPNLIGVPWETTICATDLLLSGMLDRYPNVKILLAHGGGFLPYQIGRLDKGYEQWKTAFTKLTMKPSEYLKRFWYDSVVWNPQVLKLLVNLVGEDRVAPGSDFPFDLSVWPPTTDINITGIQSLLPEICQV